MQSKRVVLLTACLLALLGCGADPEPSAGRENDEAAGGDRAGGTTGDFSGDQRRCEQTSQVEREDASLLGFSPQSVLDYALGRYEIPLRWGTGCESQRVCSSERACEPAYADDPTGLLGEDTTLVIELEASDRAAEADHPSDEQPSCAQTMRVPVRATITSADGALAETAIETDLATAHGHTADMRFDRELSALAGSLGSAELGLPDTAMLYMTFGFYTNQVWLETYVVPEPAQAMDWTWPDPEDTLLTDLLHPADECVLELPRASVDQTDPERRAPERTGTGASDAD